MSIECLFWDTVIGLVQTMDYCVIVMSCLYLSMYAAHPTFQLKGELLIICLTKQAMPDIELGIDLLGNIIVNISS